MKLKSKELAFGDEKLTNETNRGAVELFENKFLESVNEIMKQDDIAQRIKRVKSRLYSEEASFNP